MLKIDISEIKTVLSTVQHPAKGSDIISLDMVEDLKTDGNKIRFKLVFQRQDPLSDSIKEACEKVLTEKFPEMKPVILVLVREKKMEKSTLDLDQAGLDKVKKVIAVASGKGGVGKSTIAVNLAITLARMGYKVGLADADVYGPSIPKMTGTEGWVPKVEILPKSDQPADNEKKNSPCGEEEEDNKELIVPVEKFGVKWMSIGYFAPPEQALIWRGPMACNALKQMILQVKWGELDYLLIDLPPGTGDIHISLVMEMPLTGAIIVSTPQAVALSDVEKGINLFRHQNVNKAIYGIVENMAWFTPAELPDNKYYIFGKNGCEEMCRKYNVPLLGQIPLVQSIREGGDGGHPAAMNDGPMFDAMKLVAEKL